MAPENGCPRRSAGVRAAVGEDRPGRAGNTRVDSADGERSSQRATGGGDEVIRQLDRLDLIRIRHRVDVTAELRARAQVGVDVGPAGVGTRQVGHGSGDVVERKLSAIGDGKGVHAQGSAADNSIDAGQVKDEVTSPLDLKDSRDVILVRWQCLSYVSP